MDETRECHPCVFQPAVPFLNARLWVRELLSIVGTEDLAETDRRFLKFALEFEKHCVGRGEDGDRAIIVTLAIAWQRLPLLSPKSLTRVGEADLAKYRLWEHETKAA